MSSPRRHSQQPRPTAANRRQTQQQIAQLLPGLAIEEADLGAQLFVAASQLVRDVETHIQGRYGLSTSRFAVLVTLSSAPGGQRTPSELADLLSVSRPTITGIVDGLVKEGLVQRCPDQTNRRNQPVALTEHGRGVVRKIGPDHFQRLAAATSSFTPAQRKLLRRAVTLIPSFGDCLVEGMQPEIPADSA